MFGSEQKIWWKEAPTQVEGDLIIGEIREGSSGMIGKNNVQTIYQNLGKPTEEDKEIIDQEFAKLWHGFEGIRDQLDDKIAEMAEFQIRLLQNELSKTDENEKPSSNTITSVSKWLLENIPEMTTLLISLFANQAIGKMIIKSGEATIEWLKETFSMM